MAKYDIIENKYGELIAVDAKTLKPLTGERLAKVEQIIERESVAALKEIAQGAGITRCGP